MINSQTKYPKIAVIGGGTGSFTLLSKLKKYTPNITAIVNMSDDGGSTGILRDELGVLPPGDIRQCLVALADESSDIRELFNYRFESGSLEGHSFGNLFISALEKTSGDFGDAVNKASNILNITGRVLPVTLTDSHLELETSDGVVVRGEFAVAQTSWKKGVKPNLRLTPKSVINPDVCSAILDADLVVVAPGHLYGSLAPALLVEGMGKLLKNTKAPVVYVCNLVTKPGQTEGFTVQDFADEINRFAQANVLNYVLFNSAKPSAELLNKYAKQGELAVEESNVGSTLSYKIISTDLISTEIYTQNKSDKRILRTLIRHDGDKIAKKLLSLV